MLNSVCNTTPVMFIICTSADFMFLLHTQLSHIVTYVFTSQMKWSKYLDLHSVFSGAGSLKRQQPDDKYLKVKCFAGVSFQRWLVRNSPTTTNAAETDYPKFDEYTLVCYIVNGSIVLHFERYRGGTIAWLIYHCLLPALTLPAQLSLSRLKLVH